MTFDVYLDKKKEFRWRIWSANNTILADSGEGYQHKQHCVDAIVLIKGGAATAHVFDSTSGQIVLIKT
jgi:uncharacterized protein YegP (UPF0339 family)